jgi:hypothetical protein
MRNPIQEYNLARSMPIQALAAVLRGVSDMVSLGVAHAALKEKMEAEVAKKGMQSMQMAQAPKVLDKDLAMAQGLGASPADVDVPMGGIVGGEGTFGTGAAGGGSVVAFQPGGSAQLNLPFDDPRMKAKDALMSTRTPGPGVSFSQAFADREAAQQAAPKKGFMERGLGALRNMPYVGRAFRLASSPMAATASLLTSTDDLNVGEEEYLALINKLASMGYSAEMIEAMTPAQRVAAAEGKLPTGQADTGGVATQSLADLEAAQKEQAGAAGAAGAAKPPSGAPSAGGLASLGGAGVGQTFAQMMKTSEDLAGQLMSDAEAPKTSAQVIADYNKTLKEAGYDFNLLSKQMGDIAREKEELKGDKEESVNLRLLEAGLGILGGESPYAFVNIGKGATPALQGLAKDIKEIQKRSKEYDKETRQLQMMQNQMAEGRGKYTFDTLEKQKAEQQRAKERKETAKLNMFTSLWQNQTALKVAQIGASKESPIERQIAQMPGDTPMEKLQNYTKATNKRVDPVEAAYVKTLESFATEDPTGRKLRELEKSNPQLAAKIKADLASFGFSAGMLTEKPGTGPIRD